MPEPRAAAVAVMALLAFGVVVGAFTGPAAESAGVAPILLYSAAETAPPAPEPGEEVESEPLRPVPAAATPSATASLPTVPPLEEAPPPPVEKAPPEIPEEAPLPPITHVFAIVLADNGYETAFGETSSAPYLAKELREKGELLENYYAVTRGDLANEIALLSGQGPNLATAANCPESKDVTPGTLDAAGQAQGEGCVFPAEVQALPNLLEEAKKTWKVYAEDPHPSWRDPFSYFHSLTDEPACSTCRAGLDQLTADLANDTLTPAFSYIIAGACHDGSAEPCEEGQPAGLAASQPFLEGVVPEIMESDAYAKGGLIAITFAEAPASGPEPESACCATPEYPNLPAPATPASATNGPIKASGGGGRVGMLLLSPFIEAGSSNETGYYNHFSFLRSVEELLEVTPPLGYAAEPALSGFDSTVFNLGE
jgi:hypothetical protein